MSNAIKITPELDVEVVRFPRGSGFQYRLVSDWVKSGDKGDNGLVEQVSFPLVGKQWLMLMNEEGLMRSLTYNGLATLLYLDSMADKPLRHTPIVTGNVMIVSRSPSREWVGITDTATTTLLAYIDQVKAEIGGVREATIEGL